jgi:hypothetical protein
MKKYIDWIQQHWTFIAVIGGVFWTFTGAVYTTMVLPQIDAHIDARVIKMANDSLGGMIDKHMMSKGGGFRGAIADKTGISKDNVADTVSHMILAEPSIIADLQKTENELDYQHGFNFWILKQVADKDTYNGVTFWLPPDGNVYYRDMYGYVWDAKYDSYDDVYYFYPSYGNGNRIKCE